MILYHRIAIVVIIDDTSDPMAQCTMVQAMYYHVAEACQLFCPRIHTCSSWSWSSVVSLPKGRACWDWAWAARVLTVSARTGRAVLRSTGACQTGYNELGAQLLTSPLRALCTQSKAENSIICLGGNRLPFDVGLKRRWRETRYRRIWYSSWDIL